MLASNNNDNQQHQWRGSRLVLVLIVVICCLTLLSISCTKRAAKNVTNTAPKAASDNATKTDQPTAPAPTPAPAVSGELSATNPVERELAGGKTTSYPISLTANQYLEVVAEQQSIDVTLTVFGPDSKPIITANDSDKGAETIALVADVAGQYRLDVSATDEKAPAGRYQLKIKDLRTATQNDKDRFTALKAYQEGDALVGQATDESYQGALKKYAIALPIWHALPDRKMETNTLYSIATVYSLIGETEKALDYYNQSLPLRKAIGDRTGEGQTLSDIAKVYFTMGEKRKALDFFNQAMALKAPDDRVREADLLANIGSVYKSLGEKQTALDNYNKALPIYKELGDAEGQANTMNELASLYNSLGDAKQALDYYGKTIKLRKALKDQAGLAAALSNVGLTYNTLGDKQQALDYLSQALPLRRATGDKVGESSTLHNMGEAYRDLGEYDRALDYYNQALAIRKNSKDRVGQVSSLNGIGSVYNAQEKSKEALDFYNQALEILKGLEEPFQQSVTLGSLGFAYERLGETDKALEVVKQSLAIREKLGDRFGQVRSLNGLGRIYARTNQTEPALNSYKQALTLSREIGYRTPEAIALYGLARLERDRGNLNEAKTNIEAALVIIESVRGKIVSQELRSSYFATVQEYYEFYKDLLMRMDKQQPGKGFDAAALQASERARARSLLEILSQGQDEIRQGVDTALLEREKTLQQQLNGRVVAQLRLLAGKHTDEQVATMAKELATLESGLQDIQTQIRQSSPRYASLTQPEPLALKEIQQQVLDDDTILLEYALGEDRSFLWLVTRNSLKSFELPRRADIETAALQVHKLFGQGAPANPSDTPEQRTLRKVEIANNEYPAAAATLSKMILSPLAGKLGKKRLLIVAEGALQLVPFGALPVSASKDAPPLLIDHEISYLPSASTVIALRHDKASDKPADKAVFVLADPVFEKSDDRLKVAGDAAKPAAEVVASMRKLVKVDMASSINDAGLTIKRLPFTRAEAEGICTVLNNGQCQQAFDFSANRATLTSPDLSHYRIVHLATHGFFNFANPSLSGLVLALVDEKGAPQDGFLLANEVFNLNLPAELVVLSACETGLGKQVRGEGIVGLTRGFMYAGVPRVVVSLWSVDDKATAELMVHFYQGMLGEKHLAPAAALRAAQIEMWKQKAWKSPYFWAAFQLHGEWK